MGADSAFPEPLISLVVSTIGRTEEFGRLLDSLAVAPEAAAIELVVIDQSSDKRCARLIEDRPPPGPWHVGSSAPGVSAGRNAGLRFCRAPIVAFPDDDCWYAPDTVSTALAALATKPQLAGVSGLQLTASGRPSMLRWHRRPCRVRRTNVQRTTISSTLFLRREAVERVGGFDEGLGVGSPGPYGAGEDSDLVLKLLACGDLLDYVPGLAVYQEDDYREPGPELVAKRRLYGSGFGYVWRRHRLSVVHLGYVLGRKTAAVVLRGVRGRWVPARADAAFVRAAIRGWRAGSGA